ncbi:MAG: hypothetical protein WA081_05595 [Desulfosalsimonadaceae bacterium]
MNSSEETDYLRQLEEITKHRFYSYEAIRPLFKQLGELKSHRFIEPLINLLVGNEPMLKGFSEKALIAIGEPCVPALLNALSLENGYLAAHVLAELSYLDAFEAIFRAYRRSNIPGCFIPSLLKIAGNKGDDPAAVIFVHSMIKNFSPYRWPLSWIKRKDNRGRRMISYMARQALNTIEQVNRQTSLKCTNCQDQIVYLGAPRGEIAVVAVGFSLAAMEQWRGNVCVECGIVLCPRCITIGYPTPCPKCGKPTKPAMQAYLKEAHIL